MGSHKKMLLDVLQKKVFEIHLSLHSGAFNPTPLTDEDHDIQLILQGKESR